MARAALRLGVRELASRAKVATATVTRLEADETLKPRTVEAIQHALEKAGVQFIDGDEPGVRIKKSAG
jgi:transcriptional regulator with XRE-family HTH domain